MDAAAAGSQRERGAARTKGSSKRARASIPPTAGGGIAASKSNTQRISSLPSRRGEANAAAAATNDATNNGARPATAPVNSKKGGGVGVPGLYSLTVADAVVTEYEKLLAAIPTMARHMGKLQLDTEVMAEGLERRVRSLVDGYRELNELVDQAPARVSDAASEYAQALGLRRTQGSPLPGDAADRDGSDQVLDVEGIHKELFALKEAKIALDAAIMLAPTDPTQRQQGRRAADRHTTTSARVASRASGGVQGVSRRGGNTAVAGGGGEWSYRRTVAAVSSGARVGTRGGRAGDVAAAAVAAAGGLTRRPSDKCALVEMQVDPDRPLPLPTFPGHGELLGGEAKHNGNNQQQQKAQSANNLPGDLKHPGSGGGGGEADRPEGGHYHGYFVPGVVAPRQRQSHGLPRELRAISTIPTPEKRSASRATASAIGQRRRVRSRSALAQPPSARSAAEVPVAPPLPRQSAEATTRGPGSGGYGVSASRPDPGSAVSLATARDQHRSTRRAVDALRKEMLEREARLERELDRLRDSRSQRAASAAVAETGPAPKAAPAPRATPAQAIGRRRGSTASAAASGGGGAANRRRRRAPPVSRVQAPKQEPAGAGAGAGAGAVSRDSVGEEADGADHDGDEGVRGSRPVARSVETADAQAQTAADGVQLFLHPQPAIREALRVGANQPSPKGHDTGAHHQQSRSTGNVVEEHYLDDASFLSSVSGGGEEDDSGLGRQLGGRRHVSPPGPVVFVEGEGRNRHWRPADDDRLLRGEGGSSAAAFGATSATGAGGAEVLDGGDARLILAAKEGDREEDDDRRPERDIRLTTGRLEAAAVAPESVQDGAWVELAGMLAMSAAPPTARPSISETPSGEGQAGKSSTEAAAGSPELLDLMREVVGQQREMGEERSALMQALRAEVESRRVLLANQELSLRERELALERREAESGAASAALLLTAAAAARADSTKSEEEGKSGSADGGQGEQRLIDRPTPTDRFWPITSEHDAAELAEESGSGTKGEEGPRMGVQGQGVAAAKVVAVGDHGGTEEQKGEGGKGGDASAQQPPPQAFRSNLGRMLAAGSGWRDVPLEEDGDGAAEKVFKTSLGRALAGGPGGALKGEAGVLGVGGGANFGSGRSGTSRAAGEPEVKELLWEAGRRGDAGNLSPETAVRKRASALESRRFLSAMSESESKRRAEGRDGGRSSPGGDVDGDSEAEALEQEARVKAARQEDRHRHPPPDSPLPVSSTSRKQEQQQLQPQQEGQGGERLHLSLATAVLSVAQRLSTVEERALARAEGAEGLARKAMEETRREGADGRQRQSEVMHRLEEMEHGSEKRARVVARVAREIAELREEGRLERERISQLQQVQSHTPQPRKAPVATPSIPSSSSSSCGNRSFLEALSLEDSPAGPAVAVAHQHPTPARSESRSSMSEGQLRGSFSDGELVRLTPSATSRFNALEEGELPPPPPPLGQTRGNRSGEGEALGGSNAGRNWSSGGGGGPRPHLTLLMSAHPRLKRGGNRGSSRGGRVKAPLHAQTGDGKGCGGGIAVGGGGRRRGSRSLGGPFPGTVRENGDGGLGRPGFPEQNAGLGVEIGGGIGGDAGSPSLSDSGQSLEPGQAAQRLSWHGDDARRGLGVARGRVGVAGASWLRHHISTASEGTGSCSVGEASSGAEMGEAPPALSEEDLDGFLEERGGREWDRSSRPMVALKVGNRPGRRRQTEIQRAVAEAELDLCTAPAVDYYRDLAQSTELAAEPAGKEKGAPAEGSDTAAVLPAGKFRDADDGVVGEDKEACSPEQKDSGRAERQELEPGEVP